MKREGLRERTAEAGESDHRARGEGVLRLHEGVASGEGWLTGGWLRCRVAVAQNPAAGCLLLPALLPHSHYGYRREGGAM